MADSFTEPPYSCDEKTKDGFVRMRVKLDGLKVHSTSFWDYMMGIHKLPRGKNAEVQDPTITERGFELVVRGESGGAMRGAQYKLSIRQLPYSIVPDDCYLVGDEGWIEVFLKKEDEDNSWERFIRAGCLETFEATKK